MQRAALAGVASGILLGSLGVFVTARRMSFIGEGVAHASLGAIALALLLGISPLPVALFAAIFLGVAIYCIERKTKLPSDMSIGILFTSGMALGVILLHFKAGFQPELISYLFGNILSISDTDLWITLGVAVVVLFLLYRYSQQLIFVIVDEEAAYLSGLQPSRYILFLYIITAISIVLSSKLIGIVLVSALLIVPSALSQIYATSFTGFHRWVILWACCIVLLGLFLSAVFDLPSGATIILTGTACFSIAWLIKKLKAYHPTTGHPPAHRD